VARDVDGHDLLAPKVPFEVGRDERNDETTGSGIDMDGDIETLANEDIIQSLHVLVLTRVRSAKDGADTDSVLVYKINGLLGVNDESVRGAEDEILLNLEVPGRLFPAYLDSCLHEHMYL
jgi:hypothetical protein